MKNRKEERINKRKKTKQQQKTDKKKERKRKNQRKKNEKKKRKGKGEQRSCCEVGVNVPFQHCLLWPLHAAGALLFYLHHCSNSSF